MFRLFRLGVAVVMGAVLVSGLLASAADALPGGFVAGFGTSGTVATALPLNGVAVQPNGDVVAVGQDANSGLGVYRYLPNGVADSTFGTSGLTSVKFPAGLVTFGGDGTAVAVEGNGDIVATSQLVNGGTSTGGVGVVRLLPDGSLDQTFGTGGIFQVVYQDGGMPTSLAVEPDGTIFVAGYRIQSGFGVQMVVLKLTASGQVDSSFGTGGTYGGPLNGDSRAWAMTTASNGDIVVAGYSTTGAGNPAAAVAAITPQGAADPGFGNGGMLTIPDGPSGFQASSIVARPDGSFLVGAFDIGVGGVVLHVNSNGTLDTIYGSGGFNRAPTIASVLILQAMLVDPQGRIVMIGESPYSGAVMSTPRSDPAESPKRTSPKEPRHGVRQSLSIRAGTSS